MLFHFTSIPGIPGFRWNPPVIALIAAGALFGGNLEFAEMKTDDRLDIVAPPNESGLKAS